ncbi:MAG: CHAT domain-containing protein [Leptolyngbyaceae cyanobacterium bins.59]|nr:CHAT domain-containing protein [Leptolyngbyaceae cyanobacterium bins.59]
MARKRIVFLDRLHSLAVLKQIRRMMGRPMLGLVLFLVALVTVLWVHKPLVAQVSPAPVAQPTLTASASLLEQGMQLYQNQQFAEAAKVLQQVVDQTQDKPLDRALALNFLSLTQQKLGQWTPATAALTTSLRLLEGRSDREAIPIRARVLNTQGQLQLSQGQGEAALESWRQATVAYRQAGDGEGVVISQINQAQALQTLGLYQQALDQLLQVGQTLQGQPNSLTKAIGLRSLGNALRVVGDLQQSQTVLNQSLTIARELKATQVIAEINLSLGNTAQARQTFPEALNFYRQAATTAVLPLTRTQAHLNQLSLLLDTRNWAEAVPLIPTLQPLVLNLPPSRAAVYARINFAQSLTRLRQVPEVQNPLPSWPDIARITAGAVQQAKTLGDTRAESFALGNLGRLYEQTQQWGTAQELTQQALLLAQGVNAKDITYRWQWQTGRLYRATGNPQGAIAAYQEAVTTLKALRSDLVSINPEVQFSFRDSVEPIYRELVSLLLKPGKQEVSQENLDQARLAIESLQLAELEDFFRQACLDANPVKIDQIDRTAAVLYPIILPDRLEVILSLPGKPLTHTALSLPQEEVERALRELRIAVASPISRDYLPLSQRVYRWLIQPLEGAIEQSQVKTLVFVLDGVMRNVPMTALHDGKQFLVEKYGVALAPGLQLLDVKPLQQERLKILAAGLSEARQGFTPLPSVETEITQIRSKIPGTALLNDDFTIENLRNQVEISVAPIVHLATHGEFSSRADRTFILTWDDRLNVRQLTDLLRERSVPGQAPIELLVLSACRTAIGDRRAALGLAGVAVRAGARSTIGTLWYVSDEATQSLMVQFYQELIQKATSKSESLRQAQKFLLASETYSHPYYWAPYVLVGNWL